ncbi:sodium:proton antiporter [Flaviflexus salsibiostraticola]|uniref:Sodium:proton antiporter n=1 Tax=Flaviflexus salsibiostraticola TaxID=1282737 RepID=A0A3Q8WTT7_9ACTO|nr:Na+/H+ antiporter subunit E [Flaviflexus salsibiostraticola]AZN29794.1 sodium:proton antiporter [Flaviflexus salsibiostraticola]
MSWLTWPFRLLLFILWFAGQIIVTNVAVLRDNLTPGQDSTTGIGRYDTRCATDWELTLLASLITLTPGTLTLGTQSEGGQRTLFVHSMYNPDADDLRADLAVLENRMLRAVRRRERS